MRKLGRLRQRKRMRRRMTLLLAGSLVEPLAGLLLAELVEIVEYWAGMMIGVRELLSDLRRMSLIGRMRRSQHCFGCFFYHYFDQNSNRNWNWNFDLFQIHLTPICCPALARSCSHLGNCCLRTMMNYPQILAVLLPHHVFAHQKEQTRPKATLEQLF